MPKTKYVPIVLTSAALLLIAGCTRFTRNNFNNGTQRTRTPTAIVVHETTPPPTIEPTVTSDATRVPAVTQDVLGMLLTQAYSQVTPKATTQPSPTEVASPTSAVSHGVAFSPTTTTDPVPATLIVSEPIQIANAVNTADCKIRNIGNCTTTMKAGNTLFFTWTFGVKSNESFRWGQAAVVVTRDGETFKWSQAGNGLVKPPAKDAGWTLNVGQSAKFAGSLDNAQPGSYVARLWMCTLSPTECNAGQGWQSVGGDAIQFVIEP